MNPAAEVLRALSTGIVNFNRSTISDLEPVEAEVRFHVIATDDDEKLIGGVRAACYWNTLHIELLWLSETARGQGSGRQPKPLYEKNGYVLMGTLEGRPKGHASHYLTKSLM
ncbi:GNAT family N-acetyltransferase [Qipengyuania sp. 483]